MTQTGLPPEGQLGEATEDVRVGVYVCHCGGNISDIVDVKAVAALMAEYPHVKVAKEYPFMCSDPGQGLIIEDIRASGINRVVVAACSPALHELTFRKALQRAGLNPYLYEHVNIREQVSWVHKGDHASATTKATALIRAGVEKVVRQDPLAALRVHAEKSVAVIGGGAAGMKAALAVAGRGLAVHLFEQGPALGGRLADRGPIFATGIEGRHLMAELSEQVAQEPLIQVHLSSPIDRVDGYVGNFTVLHGQGQKTPAGALLIASGYDHYQPLPGEFGYGEDARVVTQPEFLKGLEAAKPGALLTWQGRAIRNLAFIHCVGSRQTEGLQKPQADGKVNEYCSRVCCTTTLHTINQVQDPFPKTQVYDLYKDIRAYGRGHEAYYESASKKGALFFRYTDAELPSLAASGMLKVRDSLSWGQELEIPVDLVVLATGMVARPISGLASSQKLPLGADRFLQEAHPKLRPVEVANNGIFLAGTCQAPMTLLETLSAAGAAAAKASQLLAGGEISLDPFIVKVDEAKCDGCGKCLDECSYSGALFTEARATPGPGDKVAKVNPALCKGCGACVAVCPPRAIDIAGWSLDQFEAMVDAIAQPA